MYLEITQHTPMWSMKKVVYTTQNQIFLALQIHLSSSVMSFCDVMMKLHLCLSFDLFLSAGFAEY